jgi:hypothetical protein
MEGFFLFMLIVVLGTGYVSSNIAVNNARPVIREEVINYCIEKPVDCKKEYNFNKTKVEIQKLQEETSK